MGLHCEDNRLGSTTDENDTDGRREEVVELIKSLSR